MNKSVYKDFTLLKPLVVISGCTGTGKSDLAIEIAKKFNGEVISADSMQIYKGLDIVTNKVTKEEMSNISHHLMSFYNPTMAEYNVHEFKKQCIEIIEDLWKNNKLPIIAGGTQYYIESVIYKGNLVDETNSKTKDNPNIKKELEKLSNEELHEKLKEIDPESALNVHRNNRARVLRAVEICLLTGMKKSEIIEKQKKDQSDLDGGLRYQNTLLINMDADVDILNERLRKRIDKMVIRGLKKELTMFYDQYRDSLQSHGILQSIGIKEYISFLKLPNDEKESEKGEKLFKKGCDDLTLHTIQYARRQRRWLNSRFLTRKSIRQMPLIVGLNTSKVEKFYSEIVPITEKIVDRFLNNQELNLNEFDNDLVLDLLNQITDDELRKEGYSKRANMIYECDICGIDIHGEDCWKKHLKGRRHRAATKRRKKTEIKNNLND